MTHNKLLIGKSCFNIHLSESDKLHYAILITCGSRNIKQLLQYIGENV